MADPAAQRSVNAGPGGLASFLADCFVERWSDRHPVLVLDRPPYGFLFGLVFMGNH
jgi:hypothetical protein